VFNAQFGADLLEYDVNYDNSLDFSAAFQTYASGLADRLIDRYNLRQKRIVEIGCGSGTFLKLLCNNGNNVGKGYDPSFPGDRDPVLGVSFVKEQLGQPEHEHFDFLCCRHVLEHIERPLQFLKNLSVMAAANREVTFYLEVPNGRSVLAGDGLWDLIYPHVSYFTETSLRSLLEHAGFEVLRVETSFSDQFLSIEARPGYSVKPFGCNPVASGSGIGDEIRSLAPRFEHAVRDWSACLERFSSARKPCVFWGAGAKGVTFLNLVPGARNITTVIDSNPRKQKKFVPGTGQHISAPDSLQKKEAINVILLNPAYREEIHALLRSQGIAAHIITSPCASNENSKPSPL
jgi:SAM-dependent methyltransferase